MTSTQNMTAENQMATQQNSQLGKSVYFFAAGETEGNAGMKDLLGGKGANLAEMTAIGVPVPPGFTISTAVCVEFYKQGQKIPASVHGDVEEALARVEAKIGKKFGERENPLLVSV